MQGRFERSSAVIFASVQTVFAAYPNVSVFAEPGRFFARRTSVLLTRVIGKRWVATKEGQELQTIAQFLNMSTQLTKAYMAETSCNHCY